MNPLEIDHWAAQTLPFCEKLHIMGNLRLRQDSEFSNKKCDHAIITSNIPRILFSYNLTNIDWVGVKVLKSLGPKWPP